jgi:hypothetical protein
MAGKQLETATGICILPHIDSVHVSNCDPRAFTGTDGRRAAKEKIPRTKWHAGFQIVGWLMGLEPTTTGITILDSTN